MDEKKKNLEVLHKCSNCQRYFDKDDVVFCKNNRAICLICVEKLMEGDE